MSRSPTTAYPERTYLALAARVERLEGLVAAVGKLCRKEVMQRYQRTPSTLHRWLREGRLPRPVKFGGPLWRLADLEAAELSGQLPCPTGGLPIPIIHRHPAQLAPSNGGRGACPVQESVQLSSPAVPKVSGPELAKRPPIA